MIENDGATPEVVEEKVDAEVEQPKSMDDTIRETLRSLKEKGAEIVPETPEAPEEKAARIRDEQGKFKAAEKAQNEPGAPQTAEPEQPIQPAVKAAPNTWRKGPAEKFINADPEIQEEVLRRENDFFKGIEQYKERANFGDAMARAIEPFAQTVRQLGVTPDVAVRELMAADHKLRYGTPAEKAQYFQYLAQSYGVDLGSVQEQAQNQPYIDPTVAELQQRVQQLTGYIAQQESSKQQQADAVLNSEIAQFAADPKNRHFESVKGHMAALLQAGHATSLSDAYEQAVYANPNTRAAVLAEQQAAARAEAAKKAQAAKTASSVNVRSRPSMPTATPIGTMDDTIRQTLRRLQGAS